MISKRKTTDAALSVQDQDPTPGDLRAWLRYYRELARHTVGRNKETRHHMRRIGIYCRILAQALKLPKEFQLEIECFAPLHDIGKAGIPEEILRTPHALTPDEYEIVKAHARLGHDMLRGRAAFKMASDIAHAHHERYDGTGYPQGLQGDAIPLAARIAALADVYDSLRSQRSYKSPWRHIDVIRKIRKESGAHFDPAVVNAFLANTAKFDAVAKRFSAQAKPTPKRRTCS